MKRTRSSLYVLGLAFIISDCASSTSRLAARVPAYPNAGLGRHGCYAGFDLLGTPAINRTSIDSAVKYGPWLVLDSVSLDDWNVQNHGEDVGPARVLQATLLHQRDSVTWIGGFWKRVAPDSIVFREGSTFPSTEWRFLVTDAGLRGTGTMVHDVVSRLPNGRDSVHRSVWSTAAVRVPCARLPQRPSGWPRAS